MSYQSLENAIRSVQLESAMTRDEKQAMQRAQMLHKQGKKKDLKDFMMAMDASLRNRVKKALGEEVLFEQEDPTNPDTGGAEETEMGKRQLHFIKYAAGEIMDYVDQKGDMDEWFQNKLTTVHDMIRGLHSYIEGDKRLRGMVSEETMNIAGVTLQNMEHCPGAVAAFKRNLKDGASEADVAKAAKAVDAYLAIEDRALKAGKATEDDVEEMEDLIDRAEDIIDELGLKGHTYHDMHLKRVEDMVEDDDDDDDDEEDINEISDKLKGRYIRKASDSHQHAAAVRRDAISRGDKDTADKAAALMKKRNRGVSRAFGEETELDEVSQALGSKVAKARHDQASALRQKAVDEPDMMKAFKHTKDANRAERKAGQTYNRLMKKEDIELDEASKEDEQVVHKMLNSQPAESLLKAYKKLYKREYPGTSKSELVSKIKSKVRNYKHAFELVKEEVDLDEAMTTAHKKLAYDVHKQLKRDQSMSPSAGFKLKADHNMLRSKYGSDWRKKAGIKEEVDLDEYNTKSSKAIVTKDNKPVAIYSDLKSAQKDYHGKDGHAIGMRSASAAMRIKKQNPEIKIVEAVTTADKKPETYIGPDGKPRVRMVPTHRDVIKEKSVSQAQQKAAGAALSAKRGEIKPSELVGASREMYDSMTTKELEDFASTKHKGLPKKVEEEVKQIEENLKKAAADLKRYADRHGGSDKQDFHTAVNHMMSGNHDALKRHLNRQDSEPREKILTTLHKHGNDIKRYGYSMREEREAQAKKVSESTFITKFKAELKEKKRAMKEVKSAPKGYHFTRDGKLRKGDADQDGLGGRMLRSDPLDKQRSKIPPLPENDK